MSDARTSEQRSEGFAFFRWVCLHYPFWPPGIDRFGNGIDLLNWREGRR